MLLTWTALATLLLSDKIGISIQASTHVAWAVRCTDPMARTRALVEWMHGQYVALLRMDTMELEWTDDTDESDSSIET